MSKKLPDSIRTMLERAQVLSRSTLDLQEQEATLMKFVIDLLKVFADCHNGTDWETEWILRCAPIAELISENEITFADILDTESYECLRDVRDLVEAICAEQGRDLVVDGLNLNFHFHPDPDLASTFQSFWSELKGYGLHAWTLGCLRLKERYSDGVISGDIDELNELLGDIRNEIGATLRQVNQGSRLQ